MKMKTRKTSMYLRSRWKASGSEMVSKEEAVQGEMSSENGTSDVMQPCKLWSKSGFYSRCRRKHLEGFKKKKLYDLNFK